MLPAIVASVATVKFRFFVLGAGRLGPIDLRLSDVPTPFLPHPLRSKGDFKALTPKANS
jgi:hypothetical protein